MAGGSPVPTGSTANSDTARDVGDEALLLARAAPTLVARDRQAGARAIESGPNPCTVIVMDDGLQNPSLAKDLTIAVIDGARGIGNGLAIPAGPLRAPLDFQLEITDAILVNGGEADAPVAELAAAPLRRLRVARERDRRRRTAAGSKASAWSPGPASPRRSASSRCCARSAPRLWKPFPSATISG